MQSLFVTATGTDIGKTWLCCRLLERLCASRPVRCIKPIVTGFDAANPESSDTAQLLAAQRQPLNSNTLAATSPWRFRAALSADMAARLEQRSLAFGELIDYSAAPDGDGINLIEGIGGVMAPIDDHRTVLDWIAALDTRLILVTGSYLGSLSHTLTALAALDSRALVPDVIVMSQSPVEPVEMAESAASLSRHVRGVPIVSLPRQATADAAEVTALLELLLDGV